MNKEELVDKVATRTSMTKKETLETINTTLDLIAVSLKKGEKVTLVGFGTFLVRRRSARDGRNPRTGARIRIPARRVAAFVPGKDLKTAIR